VLSKSVLYISLSVDDMFMQSALYLILRLRSFFYLILITCSDLNFFSI